ncbi:hypothetical protein BDZ45DRAFT_795106 [Acephala macrosclerotiorum]|nr:hypothetical protein BDZ45DRAFT_795106 [Acephala macrosclerotiorum]
MFEKISIFEYIVLLLLASAFIGILLVRLRADPQKFNNTPEMADGKVANAEALDKAIAQAGDNVPEQIVQEFKNQIPEIPSKESSKEKVLKYASERLKAAENAEKNAKEARERAEACEDPEEKKAILKEADKQERKSKAEMKAVARLQSGVWQGAGMGGGIGTGIGMGLGAAVGTLVGGIVSIPTTGVGILGGAAAGAIHGPWWKLSGAKGMKENREGEDGETNLEEVKKDG